MCVLLRKGFKISQHDITNYRSFEHMDLTLNSGAHSLRLVTIYRPPPSKSNKFTAADFKRDFSSFLESMTFANSNLLLVGDFNVHVDDAEDREAVQFLEVLESCGLKQHVWEPTHVRGHTLDLVITRKDINLVSEVSTHRHLPSDHYAVTCYVDIARPPSSKRTLTIRDIRRIDIDEFKNDIVKSPLFINPEVDLEKRTVQYNSVLTRLLDIHAPLVTRSITLRPNAPWFNDGHRESKRLKRRYERRWRKTGLEVDKIAFYDQCRACRSDLEKAKTDYHRTQISQCDNKRLFRMVDQMTTVKRDAAMPSHTSDSELANHFASFFDDKITRLRQELDSTQPTELSVDIQDSCNSSLPKFSAVSEDDVREVLKTSASKSSDLDPLPAKLFKQCQEELLPVITEIINKSLESGVVPSTLKSSRIVPLLKKATLDPDNLQSYRPISNLPLLAKVLERIVTKQLQGYLEDHNLGASMQSAYRRYHSTETALLRVNNDLLRAVDQHQEAVLVLLDLSSAFDTIDHETLLQRLATRYGISDTVLSWFTSYLSGRVQAVSICGTLSNVHPLRYGVPQGSVIGPILFTLYSAALQDIVMAHGLKCVMYADDTQLYVIFHPSDKACALQKLQQCVDDIKTWSVSNKLKFNDS